MGTAFCIFSAYEKSVYSHVRHTSLSTHNNVALQHNTVLERWNSPQLTMLTGMVSYRLGFTSFIYKPNLSTANSRIIILNRLDHILKISFWVICCVSTTVTYRVWEDKYFYARKRRLCKDTCSTLYRLYLFFFYILCVTKQSDVMQRCASCKNHSPILLCCIW